MDENLINYILLMTARGKSPKYITQKLSAGFEYEGAQYEPINFSSFQSGLATVNSVVQAKGDPSKKKSQDPAQPLTRFQEQQKQESEVTPEQQQEIDFNTWRQGVSSDRMGSSFKSFQSSLASQSQEDSQASTSDQKDLPAVSDLPLNVKPSEESSLGPSIYVDPSIESKASSTEGYALTPDQKEEEKANVLRLAEEQTEAISTGPVDIKSMMSLPEKDGDLKSVSDIIEESISSSLKTSIGDLHSRKKDAEQRISEYESERESWVDSGAGNEETYDYINGDQYRLDIEELGVINQSLASRSEEIEEYNYQNVLKAVSSFNNGEFTGQMVDNDQAIFIARESNRLLNIEGFDDLDFFDVMVDSGIVTVVDDVDNDFNERSAVEFGYDNSRYNEDNLYTLRAFNVDSYGEITGIKDYPEQYDIMGVMDADYSKAVSVAPEQYKTLESAQNEYMNLYGINLTEDRYHELLSWWYYRDAAVKSIDSKVKSEKEALELFEEFSKIESPSEEDLSRFFNQSASIVKEINSAVDILGYGKKVNSVSDVIMDSHKREMMRETAKKMRKFKNSAGYKSQKALEADTLLTYTQAQRSMQKFTLDTTAGVLGIMNMAQDFMAENKDNPFIDLLTFTPFGMVAGVANLANSYDYDFGLKAAELTSISSAYSDYNRIRMGTDLETSERGLYDLAENGDWAEFTSSLYVQTMDQLPQLAMAVATGGGSTASSLSMGLLAVSSAGSTYNDLELTHPYLSQAERSIVSLAAGTIEFGSERMFMGAEKAINFNWRQVSQSFRRDLFTEGGKRVKPDLLSGVDDYFKKKFGLAYEYLEEPATELFANIGTQGVMILADIKNLDREYDDIREKMLNSTDEREITMFSEELVRNRRERSEVGMDANEAIDSAIVAFSTSGSQLTVSKSLAYMASGRKISDQIVLTDKISDLTSKINEAVREGNEEKASKLRTERSVLASELNRIVESDQALYEAMSEEDKEATYRANLSIAALRDEARRLRSDMAKADNDSKDVDSKMTPDKAEALRKASESRIDEIKSEVEKIIEQKSNIESKYQAAMTQAEINDISTQDAAMIEEVASKDVDSSELGISFNGETSIEVTSENVDQVIDGTINSGGVISTMFSTAQDIIQGLRNVKKIVSEVSKNNGRVILYSDANAFMNDTNRRSLARGMHSVTENGQEVIRLYMPALKANTAYHETYHSWSLNNLNDKAVKAIASHLAKAIPSKLAERYEGFIEQYLSGEGINVLDYTNKNGSLDMVALARDYEVLAEELLAEIMSDITNGDLSVEYKKGLITSLKQFVTKYTGIKLNVDPTLRDVVDAIQKATSNLAEGQEIGGGLSEVTGDITKQDLRDRRNRRKKSSMAQKGLITVTDKDLSKFKRADVENRTIIQAANQIGLKEMSFNKDSINEVIKQKFEELYDIVDKGLVDDHTLTSISQKVGESYLREVDAMGREGYSDRVTIDEYLDRVNSNQVHELKKWANYLNQLSKKNPEFKAMAYLLLDAVLTNNYDYISGKYQKRTSSSMRGVTPLSEPTMKLLADLYALRASRDRMIAERNENKNIPSVVESLSRYIDSLNSKIESILGEVVTDKNYKEGVLSDYVRIQVQQMNGIAEAYKLKESDGGVWMKFPQTKNLRGSDSDRDAVDSLKMVAQRSPWCTKTMAEDQLFGGDFYVFATPDDSGSLQPRIAIRMDFDKIAEVRGIGVDGGGDSQGIEPSMKSVADDFKNSELKAEGGRKSSSDRADVENKKALDLLEELKDKYGINHNYSTGVEIPDGLDITVTNNDIFNIITKIKDIDASRLESSWPIRDANINAVDDILLSLIDKTGSSYISTQINEENLSSDDVLDASFAREVRILFYGLYDNEISENNTIDLSNIKVAEEIILTNNDFFDVDFSGLEFASEVNVSRVKSANFSSIVNAEEILIFHINENVDLSSLVSAKSLGIRDVEFLDMSSFEIDSFIVKADFSESGRSGLERIASIKISRDVFDRMFKGDLPVEFYEKIIFSNPDRSSSSLIRADILNAVKETFGLDDYGKILVDGESYGIAELLTVERSDEMVDQYKDVLGSYGGGNGLAQEIGGPGSTIPRRMRRRVRKINRGLLEDIREKVKANPENYIDSPQVLATEVDRYADMSDAEIMDVLKDGPLEQLARSTEDTSILAIGELINRAVDRNDVAKIEELVELVGKSTTAIARLLRQCGELKGSNHVTMARTIKTIIEKSGSKLTEQQNRKLKILTAKLMSAQRRLSDKMIEVGTSDSDITKEQTKELDRLSLELETAEKNMNMFTSGVTKRSLFDMMRTLTVGNLLVLKSHAVNVGANIINTFVMVPKDVASGVIERSIRMMLGMAPPDRAWSAMAYFHALKYARKSALKTAEGVITGRVDDGSEWNMSRGLTPVSSLVRFVASLNMNEEISSLFGLISNETGTRVYKELSEARENIARNEDGKITKKEALLNLTEAIFGAPAETNLRLLSVGDNPIRAYAEAKELYKIALARGLKTKAEIDKFIQFPPKDAKEIAEKVGRQLTFQDDTRASEFVDMMFEKVPGFIEERFKVGARFARWLQTLPMPYRKTPTNITHETLTYFNPYYGGLRLAVAMHDKDVRKVSDVLAKILIGQSILGASLALMKLGVITGPLEWRDEEEKNLGYNIPHSSINIEALKRYIDSGFDPNEAKPRFTKDKEGNLIPTDNWERIDKLGIIGAGVLYAASIFDTDEAEKVGPYFAISQFADLEGNMKGFGSTLTQSHLQGIDNVYKAMVNEDKLIDLIKSTTAVGVSAFLPNQIVSLDKVFGDMKFVVDWKPKANASASEKLGSALEYVVRQRVVDTEGYPARVGWDGQKIKHTPEEIPLGSLVYNVIDITSTRKARVNLVENEYYNMKVNKGEDAEKLIEDAPNIFSHPTWLRNKKINAESIVDVLMPKHIVKDIRNDHYWARKSYPGGSKAFYKDFSFIDDKEFVEHIEEEGLFLDTDQIRDLQTMVGTKKKEEAEARILDFKWPSFSEDYRYDVLDKLIPSKYNSPIEIVEETYVDVDVYLDEDTKLTSKRVKSPKQMSSYSDVTLRFLKYMQQNYEAWKSER